MKSLKSHPLLNALLAVTFSTACAGMTNAALARYLDPSQIDLVHILAPPPAPQSPEGKAELEAVLAAQQTRTDAEVKRAQADDELSVFRYADIMGAGFTAENLPFASAFFKDVAADGGLVVEAGRISGSVIDNVLLHDAAFMADFIKAKAEVRRAIGLP